MFKILRLHTSKSSKNRLFKAPENKTKTVYIPSII